MATRKREVGVVKEKRGSIPEREPEKRTPPPLRGTRTLNQSTKTSVSSSSSSSQKQVPTSLIKPPTKSTATNASKQQGKKPASTDTPQKPNARTIKAVSPMRKMRVPTNAVSARSSGRPVGSQKAISGKNVKPPSKQATNASNVRKGSTGINKEEIGSGASAAKEHITCILKVEIPSVVEAEAEGQDQEECGEKREKVDDDHLVVVEDQEPLDIAKKSEAEIDDTDANAKVVFSELSTASGHKNTVPDAKIQDSDDKSAYVQVLEENDNNSHEEDAREVEKVEKEEDETERDSSGIEGNEFKETERKEVVVEKKQEPADNKGTKQVQRAHGKKDVALSNDVIEETASKLQEQRKNRVKALAGAFETVISLQDK